MIEILTNNESETESVACDLASFLPDGSIVLLSGDLGAGKTVFARAFIQAFTGQKDLNVGSPTFNLASIYNLPGGDLWHFDFYRLEDETDISELGWEEARSSRCVVVEWPERVSSIYVMNKAVRVSIECVSGSSTARKITIDLSSLKKAPETAFIYAAGLGERMRPLTNEIPKPLVNVAGRSVLSWTLDLVDAAGIRNVVLNTHYKADKVEHFLSSYQDRFSIKTSHEESLLETGGGLKKAMPFITDDVFFTLNGDTLIVDDMRLPVLARMSMAFDPTVMDILLLLYPLDRQITSGTGDYDLMDDLSVVRSKNRTGTYTYTGIKIQHRRVMDSVPDGRFSFVEVMDRAQDAGRLYGFVHTGEWFHLSTPADVDVVTKYLQHKALVV